MKRIKLNLSFKTKRNLKLKTPCCNRSNSDGKFVNYKNLPDNFGYCHSCGETTLPKTIYQDYKGEKFTYNESLNRYESINLNQNITKKSNYVTTNKPKQRFISEDIIWKSYLRKPENNLIKYLRLTYNESRVNEVLHDYVLGSTKDGGIIFWQINKELKIQKGKIAYYSINGKRTNRFNSPYKNQDGYYSCLFGEHLIIDNQKGNQKLVLVESEKTAIVGAILLPNFTWLSYSGINGLTKEKINCLIGHNVLIVPDISSNAVKIAKKKAKTLKSIGANASIWDMTNGKIDEELKEKGLYNSDLEDIFRKFRLKLT